MVRRDRAVSLHRRRQLLPDRPPARLRGHTAQSEHRRPARFLSLAQRLSACQGPGVQEHAGPRRTRPGRRQRGHCDRCRNRQHRRSGGGHGPCERRHESARQASRTEIQCPSLSGLYGLQAGKHGISIDRPLTVATGYPSPGNRDLRDPAVRHATVRAGGTVLVRIARSVLGARTPCEQSSRLPRLPGPGRRGLESLRGPY